MKMKIWMIALCIAGTVAAYGQEEEKPKVSGTSSSKDRVMVNVTADKWMNAPAGISFNAFKSRGLDIYVMNNNPLGKGPFSIAIGLGIASHAVDSDVDWSMLDVDTLGMVTGYSFQTLPANVKVKKNKFATSYLDVPVEFRFQTKGKEEGKSFKMAAGFTIGYLISSHTKYKDRETKSKDYFLKNINPLRYGVTGRIGFGNVSLFGYYGLSSFFKEGKGTEIVPVSIGLTFTR